MKKLLKSIIAAMLIAVIAISSFSTNTAYAAEKTPLKVTFNKKTVTLSKNIKKGIKKISLDTLKEKWGEPEQNTNNAGMYYYTWKKGKTEICYSEMIIQDENCVQLEITIRDKNGAAFGLKTGMKKAAVLKKLESIGIKKKDIVEDTRNDVLRLPVSGMAAKVFFENGKVSEIYYTAWISM